MSMPVYEEFEGKAGVEKDEHGRGWWVLTKRRGGEWVSSGPYPTREEAVADAAHVLRMRLEGWRNNHGSP